jgi:hypothetical protein
MDEDEVEQEEEEVAETGIDSQVRIDSIVRVPRFHRVTSSVLFSLRSETPAAPDRIALR